MLLVGFRCQGLISAVLGPETTLINTKHLQSNYVKYRLSE